MRRGRGAPLRRALLCSTAVALAAASGGCFTTPGAASDEQSNAVVSVRGDRSIALFDGREIPPLPRLLGVREQYELRLGWLEQKHRLLLGMMRRHGIRMWIIVDHEFHNDPVTPFVAPPMRYIQPRGVKVFVDGGDAGLLRYSDYLSPRAHADDYRRFFAPFPAPPGHTGPLDVPSAIRHLADTYPSGAIAINYRGRRGVDSGLTFDGYRMLADALGPRHAKRFVAAAPLIEEYLDTRLEDELEHARALFVATDILAQRALSNEVIVPGVTRAVDVKWWWEQQVADLGVGATLTWDVHTGVQRYDPEAGAMIPYQHPVPDDYVFQPGDIIHLEAGFHYLGLDSDWQRVGYILREGETDVPNGLKTALRNANRIHEAFSAVPRPGMTGAEATRAIMRRLGKADFRPRLYAHSLGHHVHGVGPGISSQHDTAAAAASRLRPGAYLAIEFSATTRVPEFGGAEVVIPMGDAAYLTDNGYEYFRPYQTRWYLIR